MSQFAGLVSTCSLDLQLWHRRFAHLNVSDVKEIISKQLVTGLELRDTTLPDPICEPCLAGKQHRGPIPKSAQHHYSTPLALVHSDLHGPLPIKSRDGSAYWVTFIDDATRLWAVMCLKKKSETFAAFKKFQAFAENQLGYKIKALRDDKGGEYMSREFTEHLASCGIARQHTVRNEPHQNGVAERANRTLAEGITAMLSESRLPPSFWGEALSSLVHILNCCPTSALPGSTPFQAFHGQKPDLSHLHLWGCLAYVHVQKDKRGALGSHMEKCIFIGYPTGYKGWKFYNPATKKTIISERAIFDERYFPGLKNWSSIPPFCTH